MNKFLISLLIILGMFYIFKDHIVIPAEAIRIRILANSNSEYDQKIKYEVKNLVEDDIYDMLSNVRNIDEAREKVQRSISDIDTKIGNFLDEKGYDLPYELNYGYNYFPEKEYKGIYYKAGNYESLVIKLGEGKGDNWWCVMFPPFCLLEAKDADMSNVEYRWFVKDLINKYLQK